MARTIDPSSKRTAVLDAALELFEARSFGGTPMPELADRAGVAAGTVYRFFPSKEALVNEVYRRWKAELHRTLVEGRPEDCSPREEFAWWWDGLVRFSAEHPAAFSFLETHRHDPYLDDESRAVAAAVDADAIAFVERAQAAGALRAASPELLVSLVFGAFVGIRKFEQQSGRRFTQADLDVAREAAWALVAAPAAPAAPSALAAPRPTSVP